MDAAAPAYAPGPRVLHWTTAALVLATIPVGLTMAHIESGPLQDFLYKLHETIGAVLIPLIWVRLIWRLTHPPLPLPSDIPPMQRFAAEAVHWLLYGLRIVQPIVGWIGISAYGAPVTVFWTVVLPPIWRKDSAFSEKVLLVHD